MDEQEQQLDKPKEESKIFTLLVNLPYKTIIFVIISTIVTAIVVGISVFLWQQSKAEVRIGELNLQFTEQIQKLQTAKSSLQSELSKPNIYDNLLRQCITGQAECLFESGGAVAGIGKLKGYYEQITKEAFAQTVVCDVLVVTEGNERIIDNLKELVEHGNSVNSIDDSGQLQVNILLEGLDDNSKNKIVESNTDNQVELTVFRHMSEGKHAYTCSNFVTILEVN